MTLAVTTAPPVARTEPTVTHLHGVDLTDDYAWLRDKASPETLAYLNAENAYTEAAMAPTAGLQKQLYDEMLSHIKETDESVPYRMNGFWYYSRTVAGLQYPLHCRRVATGPTFDEGQAEEILLDVNKLAEGQPFMSVGGMAVTPSGTILAYTTDNTGFRQYTLHIRDLATGLDLPDTAERVGSLVWAADSKTLFYTTEDETTKRHDHLFRHILGTETANDVLVLKEEDERFNVGVGKTRDGKLLMVEIGSHTTNECLILSSQTPTEPFKLIAPRLDDQEYYPDHRDGTLFIRTNDTGRNFRLVTAPIATPGRDSWQELFPLAPEAPLEDFDLFQTFLVTSRRELGLPVMDVFPLSGDHTLGQSARIAFPEPTYSAGPHVNREFDDPSSSATATSRSSRPPRSTSTTSTSGASTLLKMQEVPGGFDPALYASERVMITAADGVQVPVSVVYRRDAVSKRDATNPLYVYGYGSYGYALPGQLQRSPPLAPRPRPRPRLRPHPRRRRDGRPLARRRQDDAEAHHLHRLHHRRRATHPARLRRPRPRRHRRRQRRWPADGRGRQPAPGPLQGRPLARPLRRRDEHYARRHLPLTVAEYEEWGNPNEPEAFTYMLSYSPYENLKPGPYPAMLVKTSLNDSQVMYWEPAKYVARLRTLKQNDTPLLLHINMDAGHGGASGRYDYLKEVAFDYAFLLTQLNAA